MTVESKLFLISAASGTGKSSLINSAMTKLENIGKKVELSISYTTRDERSDNQDFYFFISKENFQDKINDNFLISNNTEIIRGVWNLEGVCSRKTFTRYQFNFGD